VTSQILSRDIHIIPKLLSYEKYCRRDSWEAYRLLITQSIPCESSVNSFIVSLLMSPLLGTGLPYGLHIRKRGRTPRGPSADWWVLTTANAAGTNGLTCLLKHEGARDNKYLVTHPMTDQFCLTSVVARRSALTAEPLSSLLIL
jgi:hypothetical protein